MSFVCLYVCLNQNNYCICIYIYIYMCVCVCVFLLLIGQNLELYKLEQTGEKSLLINVIMICWFNCMACPIEDWFIVWIQQKERKRETHTERESLITIITICMFQYTSGEATPLFLSSYSFFSSPTTLPSISTIHEFIFIHIQCSIVHLSLE